MSSSIALRRSPKAGAFTAQDVNVPRILLTTSVDMASPSTSSATMNSVPFAADLARVDEDVRVLEDRLHPLTVGDEVRRQVALVELHALGELELGTERVGLVDGDDAVLAHLVERLGDERTDLLVTSGDRGDAGHVGGRVHVTGQAVLSGRNDQDEISVACALVLRERDSDASPLPGVVANPVAVGPVGLSSRTYAHGASAGQRSLPGLD